MAFYTQCWNLISLEKLKSQGFCLEGTEFLERGVAALQKLDSDGRNACFWTAPILARLLYTLVELYLDGIVGKVEYCHVWSHFCVASCSGARLMPCCCLLTGLVPGAPIDKDMMDHIGSQGVGQQISELEMHCIVLYLMKWMRALYFFRFGSKRACVLVGNQDIEYQL